MARYERDQNQGVFVMKEINNEGFSKAQGKGVEGQIVPTVALYKVDNVKYDVVNEYHGITGHCVSLSHAVDVILNCMHGLPVGTQFTAYKKEGVPAYASPLRKLPQDRIRYWTHRYTCASISIEIECLSRYSHVIRFYKNGVQTSIFTAGTFSNAMFRAQNEAKHSYDLSYDEAKDQFWDERIGRIASRT